MATLMALAIVIADLASGRRPDPPALRIAATLLDGFWRFHTGDDPHWADANTDDNGWETVDMTASPGSHDGDVGLPDYVGGWMAHGLPAIPATPGTGARWRCPPDTRRGTSSGRPSSRTANELYWNGELLGGSGQLGSSHLGLSTLGPAPRVVGTRPLRFALPADAAGTRGVLAVRAYMRPGSGGSADGGGMHSVPITGSAANKRCTPPRTMGANNRRLHRRCDRADRHVGTHRLGARVPVSQQPQEFLDLCQYRACAHGSQEAQQCDRRMDRSVRSGYLCVAGVNDVGASGGRLDAGLEPLVPASVAKHLCGGGQRQFVFALEMVEETTFGHISGLAQVINGCGRITFGSNDGHRRHWEFFLRGAALSGLSSSASSTPAYPCSYPSPDRDTLA